MRKLGIIGWVCVGMIVVGLGLRVASVGWNWFIHGDVQIDASAGATLVTYGKLMGVEEGQPLLLEPTQPLAQHGPVWAVMGAGLVRLMGWEGTVENAFFALRLLSLLSGIAVVALSFAVAKQFLNEEDAWVIAACLSLSYLLIDYSGNGALYSLQTVFYLLWVLLMRREDWKWRAVSIGLLDGVSYLMNFQSIILLPASVLGLLLLSRSHWKRRVVDCAIVAACALAVASPWFIRNAMIFGDPLYSHYINQIYVFIKAGVPPLANGRYEPSIAEWFSILWGMIHTWLPNNLYYVSRKLLVILPIVFPFAAYGLLDYVFSWSRLRKMLPIVLVLGFHTLLSVAWPVAKFRYLVPMLPFVLLIAFEQMGILQIRSGVRHIVIGMTLAAFAGVAFLTYHSVPTHTYYYDGAITQDAFHGTQEKDFVRDNGYFPRPR